MCLITVKRTIALTVFIVVVSGGGFCRAGEIMSGPQQVALLEAFSSEGCSSCPPADRWVSALRDDPRLWREFVPVVFHVDYWDRLGWKDRFASGEYTRRQREYADSWGTGSVYTPGLVLNGGEWRDWSRSRSVPAAPRNMPGILKIKSTDSGVIQVVFEPFVPDAFASSWIAHAAILGFGVKSDIRAGENSGRNLRHDFLVLAFAEKTMDMDAGKGIAEFRLKAPTDAVEEAIAVAVWVSKEGEARPIQAAGGYI